MRPVPTSPERRAPSPGRALRLSVVIPVYDDDASLRLCLRALEGQALESDAFEVIVVDNGSPRPPDIAFTGNVRLVVESEPGSYAARNRGIREAGADLIAFTDADCIPEPEWATVAVEVARDRPDVGLFGGPVEVFARDPRHRTPVEVYESIHAFPQETYVTDRHFAVTANLVVRRSVFDGVGPFDTHLRSGGDVEFGQRAGASGHTIMHVPEMRVLHPARRTVHEYRQKLARTIAGARDLAAVRGEAYPYSLASVAREVLPPIPTCVAVALDQQIVPMRDRWKAAYAVGVIHYLRVYYKLTTRFVAASPR